MNVDSFHKSDSDLVLSTTMNDDNNNDDADQQEQRLLPRRASDATNPAASSRLSLSNQHISPRDSFSKSASKGFGRPDGFLGTPIKSAKRGWKTKRVIEIDDAKDPINNDGDDDVSPEQREFSDANDAGTGIFSIAAPPLMGDDDLMDDGAGATASSPSSSNLATKTTVAATSARPPRPRKSLQAATATTTATAKPSQPPSQAAPDDADIAQTLNAILTTPVRTKKGTVSIPNLATPSGEVSAAAAAATTATNDASSPIPSRSSVTGNHAAAISPLPLSSAERGGQLTPTMSKKRWTPRKSTEGTMLPPAFRASLSATRPPLTPRPRASVSSAPASVPQPTNSPNQHRVKPKRRRPAKLQSTWPPKTIKQIDELPATITKRRVHAIVKPEKPVKLITTTIEQEMKMQVVRQLDSSVEVVEDEEDVTKQQGDAAASALKMSKIKRRSHRRRSSKKSASSTGVVAGTSSTNNNDKDDNDTTPPMDVVHIDTNDNNNNDNTNNSGAGGNGKPPPAPSKNNSDNNKAVNDEEAISRPTKRRPVQRQASFRIRYGGPTLLPIEDLYDQQQKQYDPEYLDSRYLSENKLHNDPPRRSSSTTKVVEDEKVDYDDTNQGIKVSHPQANKKKKEQQKAREDNRKSYHLDGVEARGAEEDADDYDDDDDDDEDLNRPDIWVTPMDVSDPNKRTWRVKRVWGVAQLDELEVVHEVDDADLFDEIRALLGVPFDERMKQVEADVRQWHVKKVYDVDGIIDESESEASMDDGDLRAGFQALSDEASMADWEDSLSTIQGLDDLTLVDIRGIAARLGGGAETQPATTTKTEAAAAAAAAASSTEAAAVAAAMPPQSSKQVIKKTEPELEPELELQAAAASGGDWRESSFSSIHAQRAYCRPDDWVSPQENRFKKNKKANGRGWKVKKMWDATEEDDKQEGQQQQPEAATKPAMAERHNKSQSTVMTEQSSEFPADDDDQSIGVNDLGNSRSDTISTTPKKSKKKKRNSSKREMTIADLLSPPPVFEMSFS
eukprot:CAMPEP_0119563616 /NCGR_PEP_ID=MMETSP1352-20130426/24050_1 /TAXON_ID=265584 /ORGANISM="Stauroneis constricta, Strain CCMP1120" /LENGTH=1015 /DNA_ID=CAMNT_0007612245 /DNA_START=111 /DNA_END=3155 /DNA_ORIENTATION=+